MVIWNTIPLPEFPGMNQITVYKIAIYQFKINLSIQKLRMKLTPSILVNKKIEDRYTFSLIFKSVFHIQKLSIVLTPA